MSRLKLLFSFIPPPSYIILKTFQQALAQKWAFSGQLGRPLQICHSGGLLTEFFSISS
jgi:hypothetical protein